MPSKSEQNQHDRRISTNRARPVASLPEAEARGLTFISAREAAIILRADPRTVRRSIAAGDIPATKIGAQFRVPVAWVRQAAGEGAA
jgi:excisionase family DNA binding protein